MTNPDVKIKVIDSKIKELPLDFKNGEKAHILEKKPFTLNINEIGSHKHVNKITEIKTH